MEIKVFGTNTPGHKLVIRVISDLLNKANIAFNISEINNVTQFLEKGIDSVPAIQINDEPIMGLKTNGSFSKSLRDVVNKILSGKQYGDLPQFIIPIDFSDTSINALSYGHRLATDLDAVTKVLHVYKPKPSIDTNQTVTSLSQSKLENKLKRLVIGMNMDWCSDILKASFVSHDFKVGFPSEAIINSIEENAAELVIMGTTGSGDAIKKWYGSVSLDVVSKTPIPILLIPEHARYKGLNKVLIAIDNSDIDDSKLKRLIKLCNHFKSEIHIVHVGSESHMSINKDVFKENCPNLSVLTSIIDSDDTVKTLIEYSITNDIDLISLSPRSKTIFSHFFNKSVTDEMTMQSSIPVMVLK